jgi:rubrerythrin
MTTSNPKTLARLLDMAITAERAAEELYHTLEAKFAHHPEVADFWREYAGEETMHAEWLKRLRDSLTPEQLAEAADSNALDEAHRALKIPVEKRLKNVHNLEDAYQLVSDLENSETNAVFDFLITHFAEDAKTQAFLRSQLKDHIGKLAIDFPIQFRLNAVRRGIKTRD